MKVTNRGGQKRVLPNASSPGGAGGAERDFETEFLKAPPQPQSPIYLIFV
jgi:hypothetical protein